MKKRILILLLILPVFLLCCCNPSMYINNKVNPRFVKKYGHTLPEYLISISEIMERTVEKEMPVKKYKIQNLKKYYYTCHADALVANVYIPKSKNRNKILTGIEYFTSSYRHSIDSISTLALVREQAWKNLLITNMVNSIYTDISASERIKNSFPTNARPIKNKDEYYFNLFNMIPPAGYTNPLEVVRNTSPYLKNIKGSHYNYTYRLLNLNKSYESKLIWGPWIKPISIIRPKLYEDKKRDTISFEIYNVFVPRDTTNIVFKIIDYANNTTHRKFYEEPNVRYYYGFYNQHFMPMNKWGKEKLKKRKYGEDLVPYTQYYPFYDYTTKIAVIYDGFRRWSISKKTGYGEAIATKDHFYIGQSHAFSSNDSIVGVPYKDSVFYHYKKPDHYLCAVNVLRDTIFYEFCKDTIVWIPGEYWESDYQNPSDLVLIFDKNHYNFDFNISRLYYSLEPFLSFEQPESYIPFFVLLTDTYFGTDGSTFKYTGQKKNQLYFTFFSTKMQKEIELTFKKSKNPIITFKEKKNNM